MTHQIGNHLGDAFCFSTNNEKKVRFTSLSTRLADHSDAVKGETRGEKRVLLGKQTSL